MKITVCFNSVRVIVPCGNGNLSVQELTHRAVARYKKATNKHPEDFVQVQVLETIEERAILDPDDVVGDVLDDKDKVVAIFEEQSTVNCPPYNVGDGMSVSSTDTVSPDIFQSELNNTNEGHTNIKTCSLPMKDENHNNTAPSKLIVVTSHVNEKLPPPLVAPKPKGYKKKEHAVPIDSVPSEDSGICVNTWTRVGSDISSKSEASEALSTPRVIRTAETAFVAIGTPVLIDTSKQFNFNTVNAENKKNTESQNNFELDDEDDDGTFSLGRNSARQSMFVDNPVLDRWAELREQKRLDNQEKGDIAAGEREEPAGASMSPTEERTFESNMFEHDEKDGVSVNDSICSGESDDMLPINLKPSTPGDLGFEVVGYKTAGGRELGLIVRGISADGCAEKDGRLQVADRIVEINGSNLLDVSNERAEEIFSQESQSPIVKLVVSGAHSFVHEKKNEDEQEQITEQIDKQETSQQQASTSSGPNGIEPPPGFRDTLNRKSLPNGPQLSTNVKKVNKRFPIELIKGSDGLGFSITTRDNPAGGNTPIFVKSILAKGAAIEDGQLKSGDQIVEVNSTEMSGKSQGEAVNILRSTRGLVKLLIQREEIIQESTKPAVEVNEESTCFLREEGKQVLTFKIHLNNSGAAGLGISVKGKAEGETPQDQGIFVKSVIAGGAAQKDGRLQADDQLLSVNNISFLGVSNSEAIEKLRTAMQTTRLGQAFIEVTIARYKDSESESVHELQVHQPEHERPIEAGLQAPVQNNVPESDLQQNEPEVPNNQDLQSNSVEDSQEDDDFSDGPPMPLNLSLTKSRNPVLRNESYCVAIGGPYQKRPLRPSPFTREPERSSGSLRTSVSENFQNRPSSTVGVPTPPLSSTTDGQPSVNKGRNATPVPPPRKDSYNSSTMANFHIQKHMSSSNTNGKYVLTNQQQTSDSQVVPPSPSEPKVIIKERSSSHASSNSPPSYEQAVGRTRNRSGGSEDDREVFNDSEDVMLDNPDIPSDNHFAREGFGRQSMSEKRARASVDAKKTQLYLKREKQKESKESKEKDRPSSDHVVMNGTATPMLRKAKSEGYMQANMIAGSNSLPLPNKQMWKAISESSLQSNEGDGRKTITSNLSFRNAMEGPSGSVRDTPNGVTRPSQSEEQEIPITMTSKADFNAVQQKLTKKPFYRKFKIGKTRRGEYNLADAEGSPKHSIYGQEALIDFPSEQRYRQLVSHYDEDLNNRTSSLPNRRRKDQVDGNQSLEQPSNVKIGRVIVSEPTRV